MNNDTRTIPDDETAPVSGPPGDRGIVARLARAATGGILSVANAAEALRIDRRRAALKLGALARRGWLLRARRGLYLVLPLETEPGTLSVAEDPWVLAREAFAPCYVGGWSAAEYWGLTEQLFRSTLVVTGSHVRRKSISLLGHEFRLFRVPRERLKGAILIWRGAERVAVSGRERTLVDGLRQPETCGGIRHLAQMMVAYAESNERDFDTLVATAKKHGSGAAWKRLGYMAEILWSGETAVTEEARRRVTRGYVRLDPTVARRGKFVRKWGLRVNVVISGGEPSERA